MGLYGELHPERDVRGVLIFLREGDYAGAPPAAVPSLFTVAYLDGLLPKWLAREPDNPFVAVFTPLIVKSDEDLRANVPKAWQAIQSASLEPATRATLERILEFWLFERFPLLTTEELRAMLSVLTPLEQTRAYQEIFAKGKIEGEARGEAKGEARGKAKGLELQLTRRFGRLPRWAIQRLDTAAMEQLDAWLEGIFDARSLEDLLGPKPKKGAKTPTH